MILEYDCGISENWIMTIKRPAFRFWWQVLLCAGPHKEICYHGSMLSVRRAGALLNWKNLDELRNV